MLILAGVSLNATIGENGILTKAKEASMKSMIASIREEIDLYKASQEMDFQEGIDLYPIQTDSGNKVSMTTKFLDGRLSLNDLTSELKHYLIKRVAQKDSEILADVNNTLLYNEYYYIDTKNVPSAKKYSDKLVLYINNDKEYDIIYFDGYDWDNTGNKTYALSVTDRTSAVDELSNLATYYTAKNNTYKLYGTGQLKVVGEITDSIAERISYTGTGLVSKMDLVAIAKKYSIATTTSYNAEYDCIGMENGNKIYVKDLFIYGGNIGIGNTVYIIDINNDLWAWGTSLCNKLGLGVTGLVEKPTKLLQGLQEPDGTNVKAKRIWGNSSISFILSTKNNVYLCGNNANGLLGQGDKMEYSSWVTPQYVSNYAEYVEDTSIELEYENLLGQMNGSDIKEVWMSGADGEQSMYIQYTNGDFYASGLGSLGVGSKTIENYYIKVSDSWNEQIPELLENESLSTRNITAMSNYATTRFLIFDTGDVLVTGWRGSGAFGYDTGDSTLLNRCIDWNDNYISGVRQIEQRDVILTNDNLYWTRTYLMENGNYKKWYYKALPISELPSEVDLSSAFMIGYGLLVSNNKVWTVYYDDVNVEYKIVRNTDITVNNIVYNKNIWNCYYFLYPDYTTLNKCVFSTSDYEFYGMDIGDISLSEDKNIYTLADIGLNDVKYATANVDGIDVLLDDNTIIKNMSLTPININLDGDEFVTNIVSDRSTTSILCSTGSGDRYVKLRGNKYAGCWGISETNTPEYVSEFLNANPGASAPPLGLNDHLSSFEILKRNADNEILDNVKKIFVNSKYVTTYNDVNHSGSIVLTNDGNLYWFGGLDYSQRVYLPNMTLNYINKYGLSVYSYRNTGYPNLYENEVIDSIKTNIKDIAFSDIKFEGGTNLANTTILTDDGDVYIYGNNSLANGVGHPMSDFEKIDLPERISKIYSAYGLSLAVSEKGNVYAWGYDYYRVTGLGYANINAPAKLDISGVYYIACGEGYCIYACSNGKVYGIGKNNYGQLGTGNNISATTFVECVELEK